MTNPQILAAVATVLAAVIGAYSAIKVRAANKRVDEATVRRSDAEAATFEVKIARDLLADVQTWSEKRLAEVRTDYETRIAHLRERHGEEIERLQAGQNELTEQFAALRAAFASHETWDSDAVAVLRTVQPHYPSPPPIPTGEIDGLLRRRRREDPTE